MELFITVAWLVCFVKFTEGRKVYPIGLNEQIHLFCLSVDRYIVEVKSYTGKLTPIHHMYACTYSIDPCNILVTETFIKAQ